MVMMLDITRYGGVIETQQQVIGLIDLSSAAQFELVDPLVETPIGMNDTITLADAAGMHHQVVQFTATHNMDILQTAGDAFSSKVVKKTKLKLAALPANSFGYPFGYPVLYDLNALAPSIAQQNAEM
jgi:hypothetical protein